MNIDIFRHWIPNIEQKNRYVYVARFCPFCNEGLNSRSPIFRVNLKLKIYKCYNCGRGGKTIQNFLWCIKKLKIMGYIPEKRSCLLTGRKERFKVDDIEVQIGCPTNIEEPF